MPGAKYDRCVTKVKKKASVDNPYAVCAASLGTTKEDNGTMGPRAYLDQWFTKVRPAKFLPQGVAMEADPVEPPAVTKDVVEATDALQYVTKLISDHPDMSAMAYLNLMKSKGIKFEMEVVSKEADAASTQVGLTRESGNLTFRTGRFIESVASPGQNGRPDAAFTRFKTILLQEGLGNLRDLYFYSRQALESAVPIFEGKKIFSDHPTAEEEQTRPERSVRDVLGHFENIHIEEGEDGQALLVGDVVIPPDEPFVWARSLMGHAVDYAKKYPDKDFVGLSIIASGDANEMPINDLISQGIPQSALLKLKQAQEMGKEAVKIVTVIADAVSCDLVCEAGAGGKILAMIESDINNPKKTKPLEGDNMSKKTKAPKKLFTEADQTDDIVVDTTDKGHPDAAQDVDLIKKMIAKYLSADSMASEEECGMVKEAYEACKEMGMDEGEAAETACKQLKLAKHMASKKQSEAVDVDAKKGVVGGSPAEAESEVESESEMESESMESEEAKEEEGKKVKESKATKEAYAALLGENAKLKAQIKESNIIKHLDKLMEDSKLPMAATKEFKSLVKDAKSTEEINKMFKVFEAAYKSTTAAGRVDFAGLFTQPEKTVQTSDAGGKAVSFDGVFRD
jgi:hypothetical protein